jgi:DnaJ-class molecular chaperone
MKVKIPQGLQDGEKITLKDEGFYLVNSQNKGDHIITVKVVIPKSLTNEQRSIYQKLKELAK